MRRRAMSEASYHIGVRSFFAGGMLGCVVSILVLTTLYATKEAPPPPKEPSEPPARCWWAGIGGWAKAKPGHVTFLPPVIGAVAAMGPTMCVADRENGSYRCWEMVPEKCE
jgi:hypothetical protein